MRWLRAHPCLKRLTSTLLLVLYAAAMIGFVPSPQHLVAWMGRVATTRYPCENCACGCASAHECWTACCCHSLHERLVWAIREGVLPPEDIHATDDQWIAAANEAAPGSAHCSLCVATLKERLKLGIATEAPAFVARVADRFGAHKAACCATSKPSASARRSPVPLRGLSCSPATCKRLSALMVAALPTLPGETDAAIVMPIDAVVPTLQTSSHRACTSRTLDAPTPPPRPTA